MRAYRLPVLVSTLIAVCVLIAGTIRWNRTQESIPSGTLRMKLDVSAPCTDVFEVFHAPGTQEFSTDRVLNASVKASLDPQQLVFDLPIGPAPINRLRIDPGNQPVHIRLHGLTFIGAAGELRLSPDHIGALFEAVHDLRIAGLDDQGLTIEATGNDPYLIARDALMSAIVRITQGPPSSFRIPLQALSIALAAFVVVLLFLLGRPWCWRWPSLSRTGLRPVTMIALVAMGTFVFLGILGLCLRIETAGPVTVACLRVHASDGGGIQLFHSSDPLRTDTGNVSAGALAATAEAQWISLPFPSDERGDHLRLDLTASMDTLMLTAFELRNGAGRATIPLDTLRSAFHILHDVDVRDARDGSLLMIPTGEDPYLTFDRSWATWKDAAKDHRARDVLSAIAALLAALLVLLEIARHPGRREGMNAMRTEDAVQVLPFLVLSFFPLLTLFHPRLDPSAPYTEKRALASFPDPTTTPLDSFPTAFNAWYMDRFGGRRALFRANSMMHLGVLNTSPLPQHVVLGKDGWMFLTNPRVDEGYRGVALFTFDELESIRMRFEERRDRLARQGIRYYLFIPPLAADIYPDKLPVRMDGARPGTWLDQLTWHFRERSDLEVIDARAELINARSTRETYYHTDMHWNPYGAHVGYRVLMARITRDLPAAGPFQPIDEFSIRPDTNHGADLAMLIGLNDRITRVTPVLSPLHPQQASRMPLRDLPGRDWYHAEPERFTTGDTTKPRLLMFHDSFALYMRPLLAEHFSVSTFAWGEHYVQEAVDHERPDVVVQELMEMFIPDMPHDTPESSALTVPD